MTLYLDTTKRHDFVMLFDVTNGNPNGDPDAGNMPRIDPETNHGFVTDVALKRKIRDYVAFAYGKEIFIQSKTALNTLYYDAMADEGLAFPEVVVEEEKLFDWVSNDACSVFDVNVETRRVKYTLEFKSQKDIMNTIEEEVGDIPNDLKDHLVKLTKAIVEAARAIRMSSTDRDKIKERMIEKYYDIRMFGAVLTAGTNAGQVRGPVQLTFAQSISPILPMDISITRVAITREADKRKKQTEMGRKAIIPYGLYRVHGFYSPSLAARLTSRGNPITQDDLKAFWEALQNMFEIDRSASRGEMACKGLYVFSHSDEKGLGNTPAHKLFSLIRVNEKDPSIPPRRFEDYSVTVDKAVLPGGIELKEMV